MGTQALIDIQDGAQRRRVEVAAWPLTLGRALDNDVVLDCAHVAAHHARLEADADGVRVVAGESVNGVRLGGRLLLRGQSAPWHARDTLQLGKVALRIRLAATPLAPELPLRAAARASTSGALLAAVLALLAGHLWLGLDGTSPWWRSMLPVLILMVLLLGMWVALWAFASKLFTRHTDIARHLRVLLVGLLIYSVLAEALVMLAWVFDWPWLARHLGYLDFAGLAALTVAHLGVIVPERRGLRAGVVGGLTAVAVAMLMLVRLESSGSVADGPLMTDFYPPGWRGVAPQTLDGFLAGTAALETQLRAEAADPSEAEREYPE